MISDKKILFVCGHRKSGTTMFANLFDGHPELSVFPQDATVLYAYHPRWLADKYSDAARRARLEQVVCRFFAENLNAECSAARFDAQDFASRFRTAVPDSALRNPAAIVNALLDSYAAVAGTANRRWHVLKETSIELMAAELFEAFPNARFVQLMRDPRDNYGALKSGVDKHYARFGEDEHMTLSSLVHRARLGMLFAQANLKRFGPERYKVVRFEDLVRDGERILRDICAFLGISFDQKLLVPTVLGQPTRGNSYEKINFSKVSDRNVGRWRERIGRDEAAIIEFQFGPLMEDFGYRREIDENARMDAAAAFYKWENDRYHYRDSFVGR
jgi:hypothetical protein